MSPEVFKGKSYDYSSDIWSIGVLIFLLLSRYKRRNINFRIKANLRHVSKLIKESNLKFEEKYISLIENCLDEDPDKRLTGIELLKEFKEIYENLKI